MARGLAEQGAAGDALPRTPELSRSRESKGFHPKSQTVRFVGTKSSLCGFVPVQKSSLELSFGRGTQPGSSRQGGDGVARR
jgi:hypothetical protein